MNNFSSSLSCPWMTIIDYLFYAADSLSYDVSWEYIAKLLVAWFYYTESPYFDIYRTCVSTSAYGLFYIILLRHVP